MRTMLIAAAITASLLPCGRAQGNKVERHVSSDCQRTGLLARDYLRSRGFSEVDADGHMRSQDKLLDAKGKTITTSAVRSRLSATKLPFFIWSSPLHAEVVIATRPEGSGCALGLTITFHSLHRMVVAIIPVNEALGLLSNGKLETEYLDAIAATLPPS